MRGVAGLIDVKIRILFKDGVIKVLNLLSLSLFISFTMLKKNFPSYSSPQELN